LFVAGGGALRYLPAYLHDSQLIAGGYSSNMATAFSITPVLLAAGGVLALLAYAAVALLQRRELAAVLLIVAPVVFVVYKSVAVRTDPAHLWSAFPPLVALVGVTLVWPLRPWEGVAVR